MKVVASRHEEFHIHVPRAIGNANGRKGIDRIKHVRNVQDGRLHRKQREPNVKEKEQVEQWRPLAVTMVSILMKELARFQKCPKQI
jgi:hypothetical protein